MYTLSWIIIGLNKSFSTWQSRSVARICAYIREGLRKMIFRVKIKGRNVRRRRRWVVTSSMGNIYQVYMAQPAGKPASKGGLSSPMIRIDWRSKVCCCCCESLSSLIDLGGCCAGRNASLEGKVKERDIRRQNARTRWRNRKWRVNPRRALGARGVSVWVAQQRRY